MPAVQTTASPVPPFDSVAFREEVDRLWPEGGGLSRIAERCGYSRGLVGLVSRGMRPSVEARRRIEEALEAEIAARAAGAGEG